MKARTLEIRTPENVSFEFELAGLAARGLAWAVDVVLMAMVIAFVAIAVLLTAPILGGLAMAVVIVASFVVQWWYQTLFEFFWQGQTPGKRLLGLRVLSDDGLRLDFSQAVIRNLVRVADLLPGLYLAGALAVIFDQRARRFGDVAAGTVVIRERRAPPPSQVVPPALRYNSFVSDPRVLHAARGVTPPERDAMIALCLRRESLALPIRRQLMRRLAAYLGERLGVPKPSYFTEENFVLNLTAIVLSSGERTRIGTTIPAMNHDRTVDA